MPTLKCKTCGGRLEIQDGASIANCQYCGAQQSVLGGTDNGAADDVYNKAIAQNVSNLLKRAFLFLEDGEWQQAEGYFESALNVAPENARAYIGKMMAKNKINTEAKIPNITTPLEKCREYIKALRFADDEYKFVLQEYSKENIQNLKEKKYREATKLAEKRGNHEHLTKVAELYKSITGYKDADVLAEKYLTEAKEVREEKLYNSGVKLLGNSTVSKLESAIKLFEKIPDYKDSSQLILECERKIDELKSKDNENIYNNGVKLLAGKPTVEALEHAIKSFQKIPDYKDSSQFILECERKISELKINENEKNYSSATKLLAGKSTVEALERAIKSFRKMPDYKDSSQLLLECEQKISELKIKQKEIEKEEVKKKEEAEQKKVKREKVKTAFDRVWNVKKRLAYGLFVLLISSSSIIIPILLTFDFILPFGLENAINTTFSSGIEFVVRDDEVHIASFSQLLAIDTLEIPEMYNDLPVTEISNNAFERARIRQVEIPETVQFIGNRAFANSSLMQFEIPASVQFIGDHAFAHTSQLEEITFAQDSQLTIINDRSFCDSYIWRIEIPASVQTIDSNAFRNTTQLSVVTFTQGSQLREVHRNAFSNSRINLEELTLPTGAAITR